MFTKKMLFTILAGLSVIVSVVAGLTACSGGGSSAPPTAQSVLSSDGYTYDSAVTQTVQTGLGTQATTTAGLSSMAIGSQGGNYQMVMVFRTPAEVSVAQAGVSNMPGITVSTHGDVLTATGSVSAFENQG